jgi:hypothetical protein
VPLVRGSDAEWRALFERADAVSEGSVVDEGAGKVWYGSTSVILLLPADAFAGDFAFLAEVAARDLHVRLRAVRLAHREAQLRAPSTLGRCSCEIRVTSEKRGVRIDVDVQAPLIVVDVSRTRNNKVTGSPLPVASLLHANDHRRRDPPAEA